MKKTLLTKMRRGDENIGKLIVFAVTIIIAVGVLGTLAYFYNQSSETAAKSSVLTSTNTKGEELKDLKFCNNDTGYIKYDAITRTYGLVCSDLGTEAPEDVKGITSVDCATASNLSGVAAKCYRINQ